MPIDHKRLIAALRDTAAKGTEVTEIEVPDFQELIANPRFDRVQPSTRKETRDTYSKDWIAGRLLGVADTLEALLDEGE